MSSLWHLALESSSAGGSVALLEIVSEAAEPALHSQIILPEDRGSVCSLAPAIESILRDAGLAVGDLESLSVTAGPGSFTGLRVGLATAKMLAMACDKPVVPVDTLAAVAQHCWWPFRGFDKGNRKPVRLVTAINAFRKQVFTASWYVDSTGLHNLRPSCVVDAEEWLTDPWGAETPDPPGLVAKAGWHRAQGKVLMAGSALSLYPPSPSAKYTTLPETFWQP
ncbi:MAG: tRNA (adenosine(37)-N6)-threonylcarbamoyltransferase complex dimerization subunit type 1 TsaB, partial [Aureliella sp.]